MELPKEIKDILQKYRPQRQACTNIKLDDELIDVSQIDLSNNETWLVDSDSVENLSTFFKPSVDMGISSDSDSFLPTKTHLEQNTRKPFDSRTFTRPKNKLIRPSIEKYNEEYFQEELKSQDEKSKKPMLIDEIDKYMAMSTTTLEDGMTERPLHFDLSQPVTSSIFEKILSSGSADLDTFQNMSPPSLVNSMCSSTLTNLMENDPAFRGMRDTEYLNALYQEVEPSLYQSITESCSSINTDVAESFVRKTLNSLNHTFNKSQLEDNEDDTQDTIVHTENIDPNSTYSALNGTYRKKSVNRTYDFDLQSDQKFEGTFDINDSEKKELIDILEKERLQIENLENDDDINSTFAVVKQRTNSLNNSHRLENSYTGKTNTTFSKRMQDDKRNTSIQTKIDNYLMDINEQEQTYNKTKRLSDEIDDFLTQKLSNSYSKEDKSFNQYSAASTDSLDRLSSISSSSRESKLMAEIDAIAERKNLSAEHIMSTPKPQKAFSRLFDNAQISPIPNLNIKEHASDSEISSEEYKTVRSKFSDSSSPRTFKSLSNLKYTEGNKTKPVSSTDHTMQKLDATFKRPASSSNLRQASKISGSYSNLKSVNSNLRSSYTNLRPRSMVLTNIVPKNAEGDGPPRLDEFKVPGVPVSTRETVSNPNGTFVKPKLSSLPRPVTSTGIPRPASKIPGPRTSRLPLSKSKAASRTNLNEGYY